MIDRTLKSLEVVTDFFLFLISFVASLRRIYFTEILKQVISIGYHSLAIVAFTASFVGAILAIQSYLGFNGIKAQIIISKIVTISMTREIGPVVVGVVLAGRVASTIAAEVGTMSVTEQLDLLRSLSLSIYSYIVAPKVLAALIFFPVLGVVSGVFGMLSGYLVGVYKFGFNSHLYVLDTLRFIVTQDVVYGLVKSTLFGLITTTVSCFNGIRATGGALGVGQAVTNSVVASFVLILFTNYLITLFMFH